MTFVHPLPLYMTDFNVTECGEGISASKVPDLLRNPETELFQQVLLAAWQSQKHPLESLFWHVQDQIYCNLTGQLLSYFEDAGGERVFLGKKLLDEEAGVKLVEIFALGEPFNLQLIESLNRQAKAHLDACLEVPTDRGTSCAVRFRSSLLLNKQEYRLLLIAVKAMITTLEELHCFYAEHQGEAEAEQLIDSSSWPLLQQSCTKPPLSLNGLLDSPVNSDAEAFIASLRSSASPLQKYRLLRGLLSRLSSADSGVDSLLPRLTEFLQGSRGCLEEMPGMVAFVRACLEGKLIDGECEFVLTTFEAVFEVMRRGEDECEDSKGDVGVGKDVKDTFSNAPSNAPSNTPPSSNITSLIYSSFSAVTSRFQRPSKALKPDSPSNDDLAAFRERMMACNSAADLSVRDLNPLLEDYKNLLYMMIRE